MLHNLRFFLFKMPFISQCYLVWFLYYSHFTYRMCQNLNVKFRLQKVNQIEADGRQPSFFVVSLERTDEFCSTDKRR